MRTKPALYWWCQLGGWTTYTLVMSGIAYFFPPVDPVIYLRTALTAGLGFILTHAFRLVAKKAGLLPPVSGIKVWLLAVFVINLLILFALTNSLLAEGLQLYNPKLRITVGKRTMYNLMTDSSVLFIWLAIYYIWHFARLYDRGLKGLRATGENWALNR